MELLQFWLLVLTRNAHGVLVDEGAFTPVSNEVYSVNMELVPVVPVPV